MQQNNEKSEVATTDQIAERIVERLPGFYRAREKSSDVYRFVRGIAKIIREQQTQLLQTGRAHWVDTAAGDDLDYLASLVGLRRKRNEVDNEFRIRIKNAAIGFKKGVTVEAIKSQLAVFLATTVESITLVENPEVEVHVEKKAISGDTWTMTSMSTKDENLIITMSSEDGEAREPTLVDLERGIAFKYNGELKKGEILEIAGGKAKLDAVDISASVSVENFSDSFYSNNDAGSTSLDRVPKILRKPSKWVYREVLSSNLGRFDESRFNENVFFRYVPPTTIRFTWRARLLSAFEVIVPSWLLEKNNLTRQDLEGFVNAIKAAGVRAYVTIDEKEEGKKSRDLNEKKQLDLTPLVNRS